MATLKGPSMRSIELGMASRNIQGKASVTLHDFLRRRHDRMLPQKEV